jgi:hypothetical protein
MMFFTLLVQSSLKYTVKTILGLGWWIYIAPTYDNGDKTDTWCQSQTSVPEGLISFAQYSKSFGDFNSMYVLTPSGIVKVKATEAMNNFLCVA